MEDEPFDTGCPIPTSLPVTVRQDVWRPYREGGLHRGEDHSTKASSSGKVVDREKNRRPRF